MSGFLKNIRSRFLLWLSDLYCSSHFEGWELKRLFFDLLWLIFFLLFFFLLRGSVNNIVLFCFVRILELGMVEKDAHGVIRCSAPANDMFTLS